MELATPPRSPAPSPPPSSPRLALWLETKAGLSDRKLACALKTCEDAFVESVTDLRKLASDEPNYDKAFPHALIRSQITNALEEEQEEVEQEQAKAAVPRFFELAVQQCLSFGTLESEEQTSAASAQTSEQMPAIVMIKRSLVCHIGSVSYLISLVVALVDEIGEKDLRTHNPAFLSNFCAFVSQFTSEVRVVDLTLAFETQIREIDRVAGLAGVAAFDAEGAVQNVSEFLQDEALNVAPEPTENEPWFPGTLFDSQNELSDCFDTDRINDQCKACVTSDWFFGRDVVEGSTMWCPILGCAKSRAGSIHKWKLRVEGSNSVIVGVAAKDADPDTFVDYRLLTGAIPSGKRNLGCWGVALNSRSCYFGGSCQQRSRGPFNFNVPCDLTLRLDVGASTIGVGIDDDLIIEPMQNCQNCEDLVLFVATGEARCRIKIEAYGITAAPDPPQTPD